MIFGLNFFVVGVYVCLWVSWLKMASLLLSCYCVFAWVIFFDVVRGVFVLLECFIFCFK